MRWKHHTQKDLNVVARDPTVPTLREHAAFTLFVGLIGIEIGTDVELGLARREARPRNRSYVPVAAREAALPVRLAANGAIIVPARAIPLIGSSLNGQIDVVEAHGAPIVDHMEHGFIGRQIAVDSPTVTFGNAGAT